MVSILRSVWSLSETMKKLARTQISSRSTLPNFFIFFFYIFFGFCWQRYQYLGLSLGVSIRSFPGKRHDRLIGASASTSPTLRRYDAIDMPTCGVRMGQVD